MINFTSVVIGECYAAFIALIDRQMCMVNEAFENGKMTYCEQKTTLQHLASLKETILNQQLKIKP